ncbi:MAG: hypothetical protein KAT18_01645 [Candidatus Latescibacteria bacterium]|nr:hypothetical protein [Candidatus Latescibacterota bacterium]
MMRLPDKVREIEAAHETALYGAMDYGEALERFEALWIEAISLNPRIGQNWEEDVKPDIELARTLNGLSPEA